MRKIISENDILKAFPKRRPEANKSDFGYVALIGGSSDFSGAIRLSLMGLASLRAGAGVSRIVVPECIREIVSQKILENTLVALPDQDGKMMLDQEKLLPILKKSQVLSFGMGVGISESTEEILRFLLENFCGTLVIDADGLTMLSSMNQDVFRKTKAQLILTPHHGEFLRLVNATGRVKNPVNAVTLPKPRDGGSENPDVGNATLCREITLDDLKDPEKRIDLAEMYARTHQVVLLLKGADTIITDGETTYISKSGCPGMATAGSGDVLIGVLTGVLGYNRKDVLLGTAAAAYVAGLSGEEAEKETGSISMIASDTVRKIPEVMKHLEELRDRN